MNDEYLLIKNPTKSFDSSSRTVLIAENVLGESKSENNGQQKIENFFDCFLQTLSFIYFIYFTVIVYKTQVSKNK